MTPGNVGSPDVTADLPRPRDLHITYTPAFTGIVHELREHICAIRSGSVLAERVKAAA